MSAGMKRAAKITLSELKTRQNSDIDLLEIVSLEGRYYLGRLHFGDEIRILTDKAGAPLLYYGTAALQEALSDFPVKRTEVMPPSGYDEMVGLSDEGEPFMRVPVQGH
ncbi:DUF6482 family protein [Marinobacter sp.]|uniref:DUF6482 family protein n=1 Tax=Marinobacter sp. TaxID=50741 RepID=UPI0038509A4D